MRIGMIALRTLQAIWVNDFSATNHAKQLLRCLSNELNHTLMNQQRIMKECFNEFAMDHFHAIIC